MTKLSGRIFLLLLALAHWSNAATVYLTNEQQSNLSTVSSGMQMLGSYDQQQQQLDPSQECGNGRRRVMLQQDMKQELRLGMKHRDDHQHLQDAMAAARTVRPNPKLRLAQAIKRDGARRSSLLARTESTDTSSSSQFAAESSVESGASLGSGEYFMDALLGTPPVHLSLIIDTGSDLTWTQCAPCTDCFPQQGAIFSPAASSSYSAIPCTSEDCNLVAPARNFTCAATATATSCRYFYSYGDASNTTGDLARDTMRLKLAGSSPSSLGSSSKSKLAGVEIEGLVFGCGHANKGLFRGASGLVGLGRGPLSLTSQLGWQKFAYCLVERDSNLSVSSSISFGHDFAMARHGGEGAFRYTPFISGGVDTFYYLDVREFRLPSDAKAATNVEEFLRLASDGTGGLIIDSGTTLTYLNRPAYAAMEALLLPSIKYPRTDAFDVLEVCYNTSSTTSTGTTEAAKLLPGMSIVFGNGEQMELPASNLFIKPDSQEPVYCLAVLPTDAGLSILGNYQQQNMHLLYDSAGQEARLGYLYTDCARL